ncbi:snoRNA-binding rRNA-processing protein [Rhodotorula mucilaginosa]|uniref:SnoRNA-binding rRNA-processing protein n=1 Tax=Rhodotorula mucilaginosa TaxID=5537 RepID=A0A9P7B386_RHOMI|nr:snoRNA-binding rRNA-processing protein [Rhodotorula mucilaginosa]
MPKATTQRKGSSLKHDPLAVQLRSGELDDAGTALDAKVTQKVLAMAREQQDELAALGLGDVEDPELPAGLRATADDEGDEDDGAFSDEDAYEEYEELEIDETDDALLDSYVPAGHLEPGRSLADLIMEKIERAGEQPASAPAPVAAPPEDSGFNPKVVDVYSKVGQLLSRYKSGPLPKAFKILPTLPMWPQLIMLTNPETWTPHATYAATRIFASNLDPKQSQKYYKEILLEKVREEIGETGKLSVHTYMALKKAMYKPAAFFKGLLGTCTLREAAILGSVLTKVSVPVLHSGAALLKLAEMEYTGPNSLFIRVLLDKKYALPYKVVDALVFHFLRFKRDQRQMPVLWHQAFLVFAQRYKADLTPEQKDALLEVLRFQSHHQITPEIRRELQHSVTRGEDELSVNMTMEVEIQ